MYPYVQPMSRPSDPHPVTKPPGVQHPSGPHAIRSSELDCCQSYSTPPSKQVRASRRTAISIHSSQHRIRTVTHTAVHSHTRKPFFCSFFVSDGMVACPTSVHLSPWSPPRLDVSALTFPSYFSSGFLSILNFPSQVFFLTFSCIWVVVPLPFARRLSAFPFFVVSSCQFLCRFFFRCLPLACPQLCRLSP